MPMNPSPRRRFLSRVAALPLLALLPGPGATQVGRRYRIELVIFEHLGPESRAFMDAVARSMAPDLSGFAIGEGPIRPSMDGFELENVASRIERSGQGRVLARLAWDQVGRGYQATPWIQVQEGRYLGLRAPEGQERQDDGGTAVAAGLRALAAGTERYELEGRLRVWVGRFLHLETDLIFHATQAVAIDPDAYPAVPVRGSQRMNSGEELFYLDHPAVGIIARVTRIDD
ncbi:CsiV family protein [Thioalkalivibrio sp.]|uniref:CsiV family protein n=1 Tax=Thioalkalivibrio sp. TaxID=2093813 RepID=UPI003563AE32